jgi:hypothetical protein
MAAEADDALFQRGGISGPAASGAWRMSQVVPPVSRAPGAATKASPDRPVVPTPRPPIKAWREDLFTGRRRPDALGATPDQCRPQPGLESDSELPPRPRIVDDLSIFGLSRWSRGRVGSRVFTVFFVVVYALILLNLIHSLTDS